MALGYKGKILRVNLTERKITIDKPNEEFYRRYMGGGALALNFLIREVPKEIDPFSPENKLIISTSVITGTKIPGSSRYTVAAKSPLTNRFGESQAGGWFGAELKFAGFDAIIVEGKASKPVFIWIKDNNVEIRDAEKIWGKETGEVQEILKKDLGQDVRVLQCGPAGEKLVRYACIMNELAHFNGRCGLGSVMGSKNLRAIVVKGTESVEVNDEEYINNFTKWFGKNLKNHPGLVDNMELGTAKNVIPLNEVGMLPTYNFREGNFYGAEQISGEKMLEKVLKGRGTCYACPVRCKRIVKIENSNKKLSVDEKYGGPEYESIGLLGSSCGIDDIETVCKANELCARYGLDTISTGGTIAFAMECFENGYLKESDLNGLSLKFGNKKAFLEMIRLIGERRSFGDVLAEGSYRASKKINPETAKFSMTVKKQEFPAHEPRGKWGVGLGYAVSPTGADHLVAAHDPWFDREPEKNKRLNYIDISDMYQFGIFNPISSNSLGPEKVQLFTHLQRLWSLHDVLDLCIFVSVPEYRMMSMDQILELIKAVTGWDTSLWELIKVGEKRITMARVFNLIHGLTPDEDSLPERMFQPIESGALKGEKMDKGELKRSIKLYYEAMGWDNKKGIPHEGNLADIGLHWVNEYLEDFNLRG